MPIEMTERLERALKSFAEVWVPGTLSQARGACDELLAAYREARDAPEPITVADEGLRVDVHYETPLTVERLVLVLRVMDRQPFDEAAWDRIADALEAEEE